MTVTGPHAATEIRIMRKIARRILSEGYTISVGDGEEFSLLHSQSINKIMAECGFTDETVFVIRGPINNNRMGFIHFVHGNGEDVVSNHTDTPDFDRWTKE